jgi:hypothetical protein
MNESVIEDQPQTAEIDELELHVQSLLHGRVPDLQLQAGEGGVILLGHAHTYYAKQVAQHAVMKVTDLPILRNEIQVC